MQVYDYVLMENEVKRIGGELGVRGEVIDTVLGICKRIIDKHKHIDVRALVRAVYHVVLSRKNTLTYTRRKKLVEKGFASLYEWSSVHLFPPLLVWFHPSSGRRSPPTLGDGTSRYKACQSRKIKITHHEEHTK